MTMRRFELLFQILLIGSMAGCVISGKLEMEIFFGILYIASTIRYWGDKLTEEK